MNGMAWHSCQDRCFCLGYWYGDCELRPSQCPLTDKAYTCVCSVPNPWFDTYVEIGALDWC